MSNEEIKNIINNIKNNIELPADDSNKSLQEEQEDKWGRFLNNNTFLTIKNNFLGLKNVLQCFIENIENYFSKNDKNIEILQNDIKNIKDNGVGLKENDLKDYLNLKKENSLEKNLDIKTVSQNNKNIINNVNNTLTIGNSEIDINIIGKNSKLTYNGNEIIGGNSNNSLNSTNLGYFIAEYPNKELIGKEDIGDRVFLKTEGSWTYTGFNDIHRMDISLSKNAQSDTIKIIDVSKLDNKRLENPEDIIYSYILSDDTLNSNYIDIETTQLIHKLNSALGVEDITAEDIDIDNFCGVKFNWNLVIKSTTGRVSKVYKNIAKVDETIYLRNRLDLEKYNPFNKYFEIGNKSNEDFYANLLDNKKSYFRIYFDNDFKNDYNNGKSIDIIFYFNKFRILKLSKLGSGGGSSTGLIATDFSKTYGNNVTASVPLLNLNWSTSVNLQARNLSDITMKIEDNIVNKFFNGTSDIVFDKSKLYSMYEGKTAIVPSYNLNFTSSVLNKDTLRDIPLNKVIGISFSSEVTLERMLKIGSEYKNDLYLTKNEQIWIKIKNNEVDKIEDLYKTLDNFNYFRGNGDYSKLLYHHIENKFESNIDVVDIRMRFCKEGVKLDDDNFNLMLIHGLDKLINVDNLFNVRIQVSFYNISIMVKI